MFRRLIVGAAAGAAGTTALNAVTYLDMARSARPSSSTPQQTVEKLAAAQHIDIPGTGQERDNRLEGLGALSGIVTGVGVGVGYALLDILRLRPRGLTGTLFAGGAAMALSTTVMARYGVTDPTKWSAKDWVSDVVPHLAYGAVVSGTYAAATSD